MRGYTSLFSHILGSHPEVKGYSEMHQSYKSTFGLIQLRYKLKIVTADNDIPTYLFDKILHNQYTLSKRIIKRKNVRPIIMIRKPEDTLRSVINMGTTLTKVVSWYKDERKVADYYHSRLQQLLQIAEDADGKALYLSGESLVEQSDETLKWLSKELSLKSQLSKEYDIFSLTGKIAAGDPSDNIKSGKIIQKRQKHQEVSLSETIVDELDEYYEETIGRLSLLCKTI